MQALWKGNLIAAGGDAKTTKGNGEEFVTAIMYLKPFKTLGVNLCANAEYGIALRLVEPVGLNRMTSVAPSGISSARIRRPSCNPFAGIT